MSDKVTLSMTGTKELEAKLIKLAEAMGDAEPGQRLMARTARSAMKPVLKLVQRLVPRLTHRLAASYELASTKPKSGSIVAAAGLKATRKMIKDEVPLFVLGDTGEATEKVFARIGVEGRGAGFRYHFSEFGVPSRRIPAKPHLRPAMDQGHVEVLDRTKTLLAKAIDKVAKNQGVTV